MDLLWVEVWLTELFEGQLAITWGAEKEAGVRFFFGGDVSFISFDHIFICFVFDDCFFFFVTCCLFFWGVVLKAQRESVIYVFFWMFWDVFAWVGWLLTWVLGDLLLVCVWWFVALLKQKLIKGKREKGYSMYVDVGDFLFGLSLVLFRVVGALLFCAFWMVCWCFLPGVFCWFWVFLWWLVEQHVVCFTF